MILVSFIVLQILICFSQSERISFTVLQHGVMDMSQTRASSNLGQFVFRFYWFLWGNFFKDARTVSLEISTYLSPTIILT